MAKRWAPGITTAQRSAVTLEEREFVFDTDLNRLFVGDGSTVGGLRLSLSTEGGGISDGDKGDITVSASGATWTIDAGAVTYAKMQDVSATSRVLGRITSGSGDVEELTAANLKTILTLAQADISGLTTASSPVFAAVTVDDEVYGTDWNGSVEVPTKNAVYDKINSLAQADITGLKTSDAPTFTAVTVTNADYDAGWNGSNEAPTKNAVYDKIETLISDAAYGPSWDGDTTSAPSKNAVYDQIESLSASGVSDGDKGDITVSSSGSVWTIDQKAYEDVASATTTDIGAASSDKVRITGTTTITGFGTVAAGTVRKIRFEGALTLTYNAASLILPGDNNIITAADDYCEAVSLGSGNWYVGLYQRGGGLAEINGAYTDAASASTVDLGAVASNKVRITGTTTITAFGTAPAGTRRTVRFAGALTLTYNATSLIIPGDKNITTAADDWCEAVSLGSGNWYVGAYFRGTGAPLVQQNNSYIQWRNAAGSADLNAWKINASNFLEPGSVISYDSTGAHTDYSAPFYQAVYSNLAPTTLHFAKFTACVGKGDNTNFRGVGAEYIIVRDDVSVDTDGERGVLYGINISMRPARSRSNAPYDDVAGIVISNEGTGKGTEALYFGANTNGTPPTQDWIAAIGIETKCNAAIWAVSTFDYGIDFSRALPSPATFTGSAMRVPNNVTAVSGRNAANSADVAMLGLTSANVVTIGGTNAVGVSSSSPLTLDNGSASTDMLIVQGTTPTINIYDDDQGSDAGYWRLASAGGSFLLQTRTDANGAGVNALSITRSGTAVTGFTFGTLIASSGSIKSTSTSGGVGYATGAGSAVTQASSRTTGVTINAVCGAITLVSAAGSATPASFTVTNSAVAATDVVVVSQKSGTDKYIVLVTAVAAGSFQITFYTTGGTTSEQPVFNFAIVKAVAS